MPSLSGNYVDLILLFVFVFFVYEGFRHGFWVILADFVSFLLSLLISLRLYTYTASFLLENFSLSMALSNALGFLLTAIVIEAILGNLLARLLKLLPKKVKEDGSLKYLSVIPSLGEALVISAFFLTLIMTFPINPKVKLDINNSKIGGFLILQTSGVETKLQEVFGGVIEQSLTHLTIKPESDEVVFLDIEIGSLSVDESAETSLFDLVNKEREKRGTQKLIWRPEIVPVAREHARDMWERSYFGHFNPEGEDVGDRLNSGNAVFSIAGENLALAPTIQTAHTGLMNSEGHRENILDTSFKRVGIGVIDNGVYGKMFVQVFTD